MYFNQNYDLEFQIKIAVQYELAGRVTIHNNEGFELSSMFWLNKLQLIYFRTNKSVNCSLYSSIFCIYFHYLRRLLFHIFYPSPYELLRKMITKWDT